MPPSWLPSASAWTPSRPPVSAARPSPTAMISEGSGRRRGLTPPRRHARRPRPRRRRSRPRAQVRVRGDLRPRRHRGRGQHAHVQSRGGPSAGAASGVIGGAAQTRRPPRATFVDDRGVGIRSPPSRPSWRQLGCEGPLVQPHAALADRVLRPLLGTGDEPSREMEIGRLTDASLTGRGRRLSRDPVFRRSGAVDRGEQVVERPVSTCGGACGVESMRRPAFSPARVGGPRTAPFLGSG